jgi:hypothetical protein
MRKRWRRRCYKPGHGISFIVPFQSTDPYRKAVWAWLRAFWISHLLGVEVVVGKDPRSHRTWRNRYPLPFSKTCAINDAVARSHGDILVIIDSDTLLDPQVILNCAARIRLARKSGVRMWLVPYDSIWRLNRRFTDELIHSNPCNPLEISDPPPPQDVEGKDGSAELRHYGAMIQIMPREAFYIAGGADPKFRGWGHEDAALMWALDTLYAPHKLTSNDILHLWHPRHVMRDVHQPKEQLWQIRVWDEQERPMTNNWLGAQYRKANGDPEKMQALVDAQTEMLA